MPSGQADSNTWEGWNNDWSNDNNDWSWSNSKSDAADAGGNGSGNNGYSAQDKSNSKDNSDWSNWNNDNYSSNWKNESKEADTNGTSKNEESNDDWKNSKQATTDWGDQGNSKNNDGWTRADNNSGSKSSMTFRGKTKEDDPNFKAWDRSKAGDDKEALIDLNKFNSDESGNGTFFDKEIACTDEVHIISEAHKNEKLLVWDTWEKCKQGIPPALIGFMDGSSPGAVAKFDRPTTIQAYIWPALLQKRDVIGVAKTGSGKTLAFLIPAFLSIKLAEGDGEISLQTSQRVAKPHALVLAPTRELCNQIYEESKKFGEPAEIRTAVAYGGTENKKTQEWQMQTNPQVVAACPGRLLHFIEQQKVDLSKCMFVILDECDRMLDMGFEWELKEIIQETPDERQSLLFSATFPKSIKEIADQFCYTPNALHIQVGSKDPITGNKDISQKIELVGKDYNKANRLYDIISEHIVDTNAETLEYKDDFKVLVFCKSKRSCSELAKMFKHKYYIQAGEIHGDLEQKHREWALEQFKTGQSRVLFATDVASRGLDIKNVSAVVNYHPADDRETHVHRIGRTGRAGQKGLAYTFIGDDELWYASTVVETMLYAGQEVPQEVMKVARENQWNKKW